MSDADNPNRSREQEPDPNESDSQLTDESSSGEYYYDDSTGYQIYEDDEKDDGEISRPSTGGDNESSSP